MENLNSISLYLHTVRVLFTTCQRKSQGSEDSFNKIFLSRLFRAIFGAGERGKGKQKRKWWWKKAFPKRR